MKTWIDWAGQKHEMHMIPNFVYGCVSWTLPEEVEHLRREIESWDALRCEYSMGPDGDDCGAPAHIETFRRKHDGVEHDSARCEEHSGKTNDYWERAR